MSGTIPYPTQIRNAAVAAIAACLALYQGDEATYADFAPFNGATVRLSPTWPTQAGAAGRAPAANQLLLYTYRGRKDTVSPAGTAPQFKSTLTLVVEARVEQGGIDAVTDTALDALCQAVEEALLGTPDFLKLFEHVASWEVQNKYDDKGQRRIGNAIIAVELAYHEQFPPIMGIVAFAGVNLYVDSLNIDDPTGTYEPPFLYTPTPAPRDGGPDGRVEATAQIDL